VPGLYKSSNTICHAVLGSNVPRVGAYFFAIRSSDLFGNPGESYSIFAPYVSIFIV